MLYSFDQHQLKDRASLPASEPTDEQLMERIQQRDEAALATLLKRHHALIATLIRNTINNDFEVDELVQECLLEVWTHASGYSAEKGSVLGWITVLVRRRSIDRIRRKTAYGRAQDRFREEVFTVCPSVHAGADEEAAQSDQAEAVARLMAKLPEAQQQAVQLAFYNGMSQREIAAHTGVPLGTIKTRLELALAKLRAAVLVFNRGRQATHV